MKFETVREFVLTPEEFRGLNQIYQNAATNASPVNPHEVEVVVRFRKRVEAVFPVRIDTTAGDPA